MTRNQENRDATRRLQHQPNDSSQIVRSCETVSRTTAPSCRFQKAVDNVVCPMRASMIFEFATAVQFAPAFSMRFMDADLERWSPWVWFSRR
jgi:hypothetical protein